MTTQTYLIAYQTMARTADAGTQTTLHNDYLETDGPLTQKMIEGFKRSIIDKHNKNHLFSMTLSITSIFLLAG